MAFFLLADFFLSYTAWAPSATDAAARQRGSPIESWVMLENSIQQGFNPPSSIRLAGLARYERVHEVVLCTRLDFQKLAAEGAEAILRK